MSLADDYRHQLGWRAWDTVLDELPPLAGKLVLDLGCAVGDQAALLAEGGARVVGLDANEELLAAARERALPGVELRHADLRALGAGGAELPFAEPADGLWCSFVAAYFVDLAPALRAWSRLLRPGGWIALVEVDDLFGHAPLDERAARHLEAYAADALAAGRYDFRMGRKLADALDRAGFDVRKELSLPDRGLAFDGPADPDVLAAWRARLERLARLRDVCGADFEAVRDGFLACLARDDHASRASVRACLAVAPGPGPG